MLLQANPGDLDELVVKRLQPCHVARLVPHQLRARAQILVVKDLQELVANFVKCKVLCGRAHAHNAEDDPRHGHQQRAAPESAIGDQLEHTIMRSAQQLFCDAAGERVALRRHRAGAGRVRLDDHVNVPEQRVVVHQIHLGW